ncbi:MAG: AMP-binding protein, partial [Tumebacillaceae bacterium]
MVDTLAKSTTLVDLLRWRAVQQPDQRAYTFLLEEEGEVHITYAELDRKARAVGAMLQSLGSNGERALLLYPPGLEYITAFFGCLYAGVNAVPAYPPRLNGNLGRLQAIAADAQAKFALTTSTILTNVEGRFADSTDLTLKWLVTDDIPVELADSWKQPLIDRNTLAFLQYTSGSTSLPKGVMLSHNNLLHNLQLIHESFDIRPDSNCVIWLPPYHDMGLIGGILQPFFGGYPVTLMSPVSFVQRPLRWLETISRNRATLSGGPNFAYELCVQKITPEQRATLDLSTWQTAFTGAEPIRQETLERFVQAFEPCGFRREAFYPCYGLAESTLFVTGGLRTEAPIVQSFDGEALKDNRVIELPEGQAEARTLVGCGHPRMEQQQVAIVDPTSMMRVAEDQVGEIWVSGQSIAVGYWNMEEKTAETFGAVIADTGEGPFLRTGDLGFMKDGELYVTGRLKDLIIIRGRNYYPQDIEYTMQTCHPALKPDFGAAFSVEADGEERLVVVQEIDRQFRKSNLDEVVSAVRQAVAEQHQLQVYAVVLIKPASIPKTSSGKIQRHACRERFLSGALDVVKQDVLDGQGASVNSSVESLSDGTEEAASVAITREELLAMDRAQRQTALEAYLLVKAALVLKMTPAQLDVQQPLSRFGLDSLMAVELKNSIEESAGVILPVTTFLEGPSIAQLSNDVLEELEKATTDSFADAIEAAQAAGEFKSSYGQRALWFMQRLAPESAAYNISHAVRIDTQLDVEALRKTFARLAERHPLMRATFHLRGDEVFQRVHADRELAFTIHDASGLGEAELQAKLTSEAHSPFDLEKGPLVRVNVFSRSADEHILQMTLHHIIVDFWSLSVLVNELRTLYPLVAQGDVVTLTESAWGYAEYVAWQSQMLQGADGERHFAYWKEQLSGSLPVLNLPTDR